MPMDLNRIRWCAAHRDAIIDSGKLWSGQDVFIQHLGLKLMPRYYPLKPVEYAARMDILAASVLNTKDAEEGLAPVLWSSLGQNIWSQFLSDRINTLRKVVNQQNFSACPQVGRSIAGCGPGLTPSSDDFLVGLFASLYSSLERDTAKELCLGLAEGAVPATGSVSAGFIESGARGYFSEDILHLAAAFFDTKTLDDLPLLADNLCRLGSTSGPDTMTGFYFGLTVTL